MKNDINAVLIKMDSSSIYNNVLVIYRPLIAYFIPLIELIVTVHASNHHFFIQSCTCISIIYFN